MVGLDDTVRVATRMRVLLGLLTLLRFGLTPGWQKACRGGAAAGMKGIAGPYRLFTSKERRSLHRPHQQIRVPSPLVNSTALSHARCAMRNAARESATSSS